MLLFSQQCLYDIIMTSLKKYDEVKADHVINFFVNFTLFDNDFSLVCHARTHTHPHVITNSKMCAHIFAIVMVLDYSSNHYMTFEKLPRYMGYQTHCQVRSQYYYGGENYIYFTCFYFFLYI